MCRYYGTLHKDQKEKYDEILRQDYNSSNLGRIIGTVEITDCIKFGFITENGYSVISGKSYEPEAMINSDSYYWKLANPIKFSSPIPYKPPKGAIVWSKTELPEGYV
jgi:hypothetical protein